MTNKLINFLNENQVEYDKEIDIKNKLYKLRVRIIKYQPFIRPYWEPEESILVFSKSQLYSKIYDWYNNWKNFFMILETSTNTLFRKNEEKLEEIPLRIRIQIHLNPYTFEMVEYIVGLDEEDNYVLLKVNKIKNINESVLSQYNYITYLTPDKNLLKKDLSTQFRINFKKLLDQEGIEYDKEIFDVKLD